MPSRFGKRVGIVLLNVFSQALAALEAQHKSTLAKLIFHFDLFENTKLRTRI